MPTNRDSSEGYLKKHETCLFVVGAGHMAGKEGVVELVRKKGYTVEQIYS